MNEFNNRIDAQRAILELINAKSWDEELYGLSSGAIDRWVAINKLDPSGPLALAISDAADQLFFLANKSQEQISDDYALLSRRVSGLTKDIKNILLAAA